MSPRSMSRAGARAIERSSRRAARRRHAARAAFAGAVIGAVALPGAAAGATFTVTSNGNAGPGTLRQAINDANGTTLRDTIAFAPGLPSPITLTGGTIPITRSLTIDGPGSGALEVVAPGGVALFVNDTLPSGIEVEIEGLTLEGHSTGSGSAGGGLTSGSGTSTTVRNCVISGGTAANQGGGIFVQNTKLSVIDSTISGNTAGSLGGAIYGRDATVVVSGSTLSGNEGLEGGAIAMAETGSSPDTSLTVTGSRITGNHADPTHGGGGISVSSSDGPTSIARSTVSGNSAGYGGGLYFGYGSTLAIDSSTFSGNSSSLGGAIEVYAPSGPSLISNSTIAANTSSGNGGGIYSFGYFDKPVRIQNSTIASNAAAGAGGGIFRFGYDGSGPLYAGPDEIALSSTIVADNTAAAGSNVADGPLADGSFVVDHSIVGSTSGAAVTQSAPGTNRLNSGLLPLGPLAANGGPTQTMLLPPGSPAVDAGAANGLLADQRGLPRTVEQPGGPTGGDGTDVGAVELPDSSVDGPRVKAKRKQKVKGRKVVIAVKAGASEAVTVAATGTVKLGKKKLGLSEATATIPAETSKTLRVRPKNKKSLKKLTRALARGKTAKAALEITLTDSAGNQESLPAKVTLSAERKR